MEPLVKLILAIVVIYGLYKLYNAKENLDNIQPSQVEIVTAQQTPAVPVDQGAQNFIDSVEEIDLSEDLLVTGNNININTTQSSRRNTNRQLRSDPEITIVETGPWNQSTIVPDYTNKVLGI